MGVAASPVYVRRQVGSAAPSAATVAMVARRLLGASMLRA
jgi:hypothetical protein